MTTETVNRSFASPQDKPGCCAVFEYTLSMLRFFPIERFMTVLRGS